MMESRMKAYRELARQLRAAFSPGELELFYRDGRMVVAMQDDVLFPSGVADLTKAGQAVLAKLAGVLRKVPKERRFLIAGHTDDVPIGGKLVGKFRSNWELSSSRALAATRFLTEHGVQPQRLAAAGFGPYRPVGDNLEPEGRKRNRRTEVVVLPTMAEIPPLPPETEG